MTRGVLFAINLEKRLSAIADRTREKRGNKEKSLHATKCEVGPSWVDQPRKTWVYKLSLTRWLKYCGVLMRIDLRVLRQWIGRFFWLYKPR